MDAVELYWKSWLRLILSMCLDLNILCSFDSILEDNTTSESCMIAHAVCGDFFNAGIRKVFPYMFWTQIKVLAACKVCQVVRDITSSLRNMYLLY